MSNATWACCSSLNPCEEAEGDCDNDYDCLGNLKCGKNNCHPPFDEDADCCYDPLTFRKEILTLRLECFKTCSYSFPDTNECDPYSKEACIKAAKSIGYKVANLEDNGYRETVDLPREHHKSYLKGHAR